MFEGFAGAVATAVLAGLGYAGKVWLDRRSASSSPQEIRAIFDLYQALANAGVSPADLVEFWDEVRRWRSLTAKNEEQIVARLKLQLEALPERGPPALDMPNPVAKQLDLSVGEIEGLLDAGRRRVFKKAQSAWLSYVQQQAEFAASEVGGGTARTLVYGREVEDMMLRRAAVLQSEIARLRELSN